jgi:oligoendopeptidase F
MRRSVNDAGSKSAAARSKAAEALGALAHYRPWLDNLRMEKPYQLEDRLEQLFHEKSHDRGGRLQPPVR